MMKQPPLTDLDRELLARGVEGHCIQGEWIWTHRGVRVGRRVNSLIKRGLLKPTYFPGYRAAASPTDKARELTRL